jgi:RNA polymerase sigma-70 factor, ECF subfamily
VPLADQDPALWDHAMIEEAEALLSRASRIGATGRYQIEAAIQSAHVVRRRTGNADWGAIEKLYAALAVVTHSPVVTINRAVALAETQGPAAGLDLLDTVSMDVRLNDYQPYWAARAKLLTQAGDRAAAVAAYDRAIGLEADPAVRRFLLERRAALQEG